MYPVIGGVHHTGQLLRAQLALVILKWPSFKMKIKNIKTLSLDPSRLIVYWCSMKASPKGLKYLTWIMLKITESNTRTMNMA